MSDYMLTTADNPYNPFVQFDEWNAFDIQKGYNTLSYLARLSYTSQELSDEENDIATDHAIDEILYYNLTGNYIKVTKENFDEVRNKAIKELNLNEDGSPPQ